MKPVDLGNAVLLALAVVLCVGAASLVGGRAQVRVEQVAPRVVPITLVTAPDGSPALSDASGVLAPMRRYTRIASTSLVADHVLDAICEPERLIAVSNLSKASAHFGFRHGGRAQLTSPAQIEAILALRPDLLVINHFGDPRFAARLRAAGVVVFDLGEMHGLETLLPSIRTLGQLVAASARAEALATSFLRRMRSVAAAVPPDARPSALYLGSYGKQLYGGTRGTSYHDVIEHAGLRDVAAARYEGWPALDPEHVLALDPDVLVTKHGMARTLCAAPGLAALRACSGRARVVELDAELVDDPGLPMLEATEQLHAAVHGGERREGR